MYFYSHTRYNIDNVKECIMKPQDKPHYVNNRDFSNAVVEYVKTLNEARENDTKLPVVTNYVATCFLKSLSQPSALATASILYGATTPSLS